jgi:hypothetical protein
MNDKNDCIESITRTLERTSVWRKSLATKFEDARNLRAAETLDGFVTDTANLTDEQWATLSPHYNWSSEKWRSALSDTARGIRFHVRTKQFDVFVKALLQRLTSVVGAAA